MLISVVRRDWTASACGARCPGWKVRVSRPPGRSPQDVGLAYGRAVPSVLDETDLVVKRKPQVPEVRGTYDILDKHGTVSLGSVEQVGRDNMEKLLHPQRADNAKTFWELRDPSGPVLLFTHGPRRSPTRRAGVQTRKG